MGDRCDVTSGRGLLSRCGPVRSVLGTVPYGVRCAQRASERVSRRSTPPSVARLPSHHPCLPAFVSSIPWTLLTEHVRPPAIMLDVVVVAGYDVVSACQRHRPWTRRTHPPTHPVEVELGSNAQEEAGRAFGAVRPVRSMARLAPQHSRNHATARPHRIGAAKRPSSEPVAAADPDLLAASQHKQQPSRSIQMLQRFHWPASSIAFLPVPSVTTRRLPIPSLHLHCMT